ncbi:thiamine pyrophosphate-dependent enzyme [Nocardioides sp.]|uniref:thiamine pyrophosphate-dependent dehydrogenase E1 component subunit alpha n=1 Tax=Nocardioides sp. TaxID=35761 RepID=UPI002619C19D|nr:thiamine pyrophosphate-dependent enzyme [Nocardioides sp.]MDI6912378.1 thiamine pyrophosphate-dependent enzyme [Nocardioides sp.]
MTLVHDPPAFASPTDPPPPSLERIWTSKDSGPIQFVTPDGELTDLGAEYGVDRALAQTLYRDMARARRLDHEALALQRQGELGLWLQCWGQEAAQVGSVRALSPSDYVFPSYREHAAALVRGVTPGELLAQWRGVSHAGWDPGPYAFHLYSLVLGTQTLHATGYAMGSLLDGADDVVTVYFGDGAASQGDVNEAFNWSAAGNIPVLFICQNNQWAISTPTDVQFRAPVHQRAAGFGLRTFHVDGNDALATYAVTREAAAIVRRGEGPALVEAETFRMAGHSTSDDPSRYRTETDLATWQARDPLLRLETVLRSLDTRASYFSELEEELERLAVEVRRACRELPDPVLDQLFTHTYVDPHPLVDAERLAYRKFVELMSVED